MEQQLRPSAALVKDLSSVPIAHMVTSNNLELQFLGNLNHLLILTSPGIRNTHGVHTCVHT